MSKTLINQALAHKKIVLTTAVLLATVFAAWVHFFKPFTHQELIDLIQACPGQSLAYRGDSDLQVNFSVREFINTCRSTANFQ